MKTLLSIFILLALFSYKVTAEASPEQEILNSLNAYHQAELAGNLDGILDAYAEDFTDPMGATKAMLVDFFTVLLAQGALSDLEIDMSAIAISIDGDSASAGPVSYTSPMGTSTYSYQMRKDDDRWRFIGSQLLN